MWGLSTHPRKDEICTVSDDKTVRIWSLQERRMLRYKLFDKLLRTCQYSHDGTKVAVGTKDGRKCFRQRARFASMNIIFSRKTHRFEGSRSERD
jgi:WD40 repeat protein